MIRIEKCMVQPESISKRLLCWESGFHYEDLYYLDTCYSLAEDYEVIEELII